MKKKISGLFLFIVFFTILFVNYFCSEPSNQKEESLLYLNHSDTAKYLGINTCKSCHFDIYNTFINTGMGQSFAKASKKKSIGNFDKKHKIFDSYSNFFYEPFWSGEELFLKEFRLKNRDTIHKRIEKISYIIGSGQHTNSHILSNNNYLFQAPFTYYKQKELLDLPPGFEKGNNTRFSRVIALECLSCHNAYPKIVPGSLNKYISIPEGIDCERCHGPGSIHVQKVQSGDLTDTSAYIDYSIVNPKKLPYNLQVEICQRCHLQGNTVLKEGKTFFDFKPGKMLSEYQNVFLPEFSNSGSDFIMASHADRFKQSKCFINSKNIDPKIYKNSKLKEQLNSFSCISCHNPHVSVKETSAIKFNSVCNNCHNPNSKLSVLKNCTEKINIRKLKGDNCWKCHMPNSGTLDIPHVSIHDHKIQRPIKEIEKKLLKKFLGLRSVNEANPSPIIKAEAYLNYFEKFEGGKLALDSAKNLLAGIKTDSKKKEELYIRWYFLNENWVGLNAYLSNSKYLMELDAYSLYRASESYLKLENYEQELKVLKRAVQLAPYILEFRNKLGNAAAKNDDWNLAKQSFEFMLSENSDHVEGNSNLGFIYLREGKLELAEKHYLKAISLDPDYVKAYLNMAGLRFYENKKNEGKKWIEKVLILEPNNQEAKEILKKLKNG